MAAINIIGINPITLIIPLEIILGNSAAILLIGLDP